MQTMAASFSTKTSSTTCPSFPSWDGEEYTKRIWLEKVDCFRESPFFSGVTDWSRKTNATEDQSKWIRKELIQEDRLPHHVKATLMNAAEFKADGFQMLQYLLSTVSNTTASSKMKAVRDLVALEQAPGEPSGLFMSRVRDIQEVWAQCR